MIAIMRNDFGLEPQSAVQSRIVDECCELAKATHGNDYDAAIWAVITQHKAALRGMEGVSREDVIEDIANIARVLPKATMTDDALEEYLEPVLEHFQIDKDRVFAPIPPEFSQWLGDTFAASEREAPQRLDFDSWLLAYKEECARQNDALKMTEDGGSFVDFVDQDPLRRAHRDGVNPEQLARAWAPSFDPLTFGKG